MYVYIQSEQMIWTVGFFDPNGKWMSESDHSNSEDASKRVHYLNGGGINDIGYNSDAFLGVTVMLIE